MPEEILSESNDCTATVKIQLEALIQQYRPKRSADTNISKKNYAVEGILDFLEKNLEEFSSKGEMNEEILEKLSKYIDSPCSLQRLEDPKLLECGHTLDFFDIFRLKELLCLECRKKIDQESMIENKDLLSLISELESLFPSLKQDQDSIQEGKLKKILLSLGLISEPELTKKIDDLVNEFGQSKVVEFIRSHGVSVPIDFKGNTFLSLTFKMNNLILARCIALAIFEKENIAGDKSFRKSLYEHSNEISGFLNFIELFERALNSDIFDKVLLSISGIVVNKSNLDLFKKLMLKYPKIVNFDIGGYKWPPLYYFVRLTNFTEDDLDFFVEKGANLFLATPYGETVLGRLLEMSNGDEIFSRSILKWSDELLKLINEKVIGYDSEGASSDRYWLDIVVKKAGIKTIEQLLERSVVDFSKLESLNSLFYFPYSELVRKKITHRLLAEYLLDSEPSVSPSNPEGRDLFQKIRTLSEEIDLDFQLLKHYIDILSKRSSLEDDNKISQFLNKLIEKNPTWSDISLCEDSQNRLRRLRNVAYYARFENRYEQQGVIKNAFFDYMKAGVDLKTDQEKIVFWKKAKSASVFSQHRKLNPDRGEPFYSLKILWHWLETFFTVCHTVKKIEREIQQLEKKQSSSVGCWAGFWSCSKMSQNEPSSSSKNLPSNP